LVGNDGYDGDNQNSKGKDESSFTEDRNKGYSFNGKVIIGIAIVVAIAAGSTIYGLTLSESPRIHLSTSSLFQKNNAQFLSGPTTTSSSQNAKAQLANHQQQITRKIVLVQHDFGWNGTNGGPTIRVNKGDVVQITIINAGQMAHNFGIGKPSQQTMNIMKSVMQLPLSERVQKIPYNVMAAMPCPGCQPQFEDGHIKQFMKPDTQMVTTFTANKAGNYKYFCMVRGHIWLGMVGDFDVVDVGNSSTMQAQQQGSGKT
jgi:uncharacterized cupredoxin-like copper-binding protein